MTTLTDGQVESRVAANQRRVTWERCVTDLAPFVTRHVTWRALAAGDIRSKYRRTILGPWWITATNALTALIMGLVAGRFLGADMRTYLPNFMISMTIWSFISSSLSESCFTMINAGGMIKAVNMPILIHVMRMVHRNLIIFLHNIAVIPLIWLVYPWHIGIQSLLAPLGLLIVYVATVSGSVIVSMICVRYRDVPPVMTSLLQLLFFVSPIIWVPENIKGGELFVALNPVAYLLAVTRDPIMGSSPHLMSWIGAILFVAVATAAMGYIYTRYRSRVVYWA
jgi:lipopolysaccharide transport system permease protein